MSETIIKELEQICFENDCFWDRVEDLIIEYCDKHKDVNMECDFDSVSNQYCLLITVNWIEDGKIKHWKTELE